MKTLFKATMKPRRRLECHVEQTTLIKRTKIKANSSDYAGSIIPSLPSVFILRFDISQAGIAARILTLMQGSEEKE